MSLNPSLTHFPEAGSDSDSDSDPQADQTYSEMSMEELLKLQEDIGTKAFQQKMLKRDEGGATRSSSSRVQQSSKEFKRANKNRPREVPMMRRAAPRLNFLDPDRKVKREVTRDPRFDDLSGTLNLKIWQENYGFLKETRKKELEILKKELKEEQDTEKRRKIKSIIQRMENQEREQAKREKEKEVVQLEKQQQREALKQGKKPMFVTRKDRKLLLKAKHFEELKKGNKVDKYLERKEKRLRAKEMKRKRD